VESFAVTLRDHPSGFPVVTVTGYLARDGGLALKDCFGKALAAGKTRILLDLSACSIIASPGVAAILESVCRTYEDYHGQCVLVGLDDTKREFLTMMGVLPLVGDAASLEQAAALLQAGGA